jgi:uncharacterized membrane protein YeaQ/YmgE (transglycosylase-associated protein family)
MFSLIGNIIAGLIAGFLAKAIMKTGPDGWIMTAVLGIAGSIVGGLLFGLLKIGGGGASGIVGSVIGAVLLLWLWGKFIVKK